MTERAFHWFLYWDDDGGKIRIKAKRRPGPNTSPRSGTWVVQEWTRNPQTGESKWVMPPFPEITWGRLSRLSFQRKEPA